MSLTSNTNSGIVRYPVTLVPHSLEDYFDSPIVEPHWRIRRTDEQLVRFGLLWRLYDIVQRLGLDYTVPVLTEPVSSSE